MPDSSIPIIAAVIIGVIFLATCVFSIVVLGLTIGIPLYFIKQREKKTQVLLATGVQGEATVLALEDTGMRINDDPRVSMVLEVRVPGYAAYQVRKTTTIPMIRIGQVQVGMVVPVIADPQDAGNPDKVGLLLR
ncbi:MAG TPA: hypothetical protein VIO61_17060 [Anaerolineaceae bacterium]